MWPLSGDPDRTRAQRWQSRPSLPGPAEGRPFWRGQAGPRRLALPTAPGGCGAAGPRRPGSCLPPAAGASRRLPARGLGRGPKDAPPRAPQPPRRPAQPPSLPPSRAAAPPRLLPPCPLFRSLARARAFWEPGGRARARGGDFGGADGGRCRRPSAPPSRRRLRRPGSSRAGPAWLPRDHRRRRRLRRNGSSSSSSSASAGEPPGGAAGEAKDENDGRAAGPGRARAAHRSSP